MTKKVLVGLPASLLNTVDYAAQAECRTRSDLIREALRRYLESFQRLRLLHASPANISMLEDAYALTGEPISEAMAAACQD